MKAYKIRVNNEDHSKAVQDWLFEEGYRWVMGEGDSYKHTKFSHLYAERGGYILCGNVEDCFLRDPNEELDMSHLDPHLCNPHLCKSESHHLGDVALLISILKEYYNEYQYALSRVERWREIAERDDIGDIALEEWKETAEKWHKDYLKAVELLCKQSVGGVK